MKTSSRLIVSVDPDHPVCMTAGSPLRLRPAQPAPYLGQPDPNVIVDNRGLSSVTDGDLGRTRTRNAIGPRPGTAPAPARA